MSDLEVDGVYRNRVYPDRVVKITKIEDHYVIFDFLEGLSNDNPRKGMPHRMPERQFARYYSLKDQES